MAKKPSKVDPLKHLDPLASAAFRRLTNDLEAAWKEGKTPTLFKPYGGYRSPAQQEEMLLIEPKVTNAGPFQSAHQYGLAVDYAAWEDEVFSWNDQHDWAFLETCANANGLSVPIPWDKGHVEHPMFKEILRLKRYHS